MATEPTIGENLARLRSQTGLTQRELSVKSGVGLPTIRGLERGARTTALMATISKLASALDVKPSVLLGARQTLHQDDGSRDESITRLRRAIHPLDGLAGVSVQADTGEVPSVEDLHRSVEQAWRTYHRGEFSELIAGLPALLVGARVAAGELRGGPRRAAHAALSRAYQAAAQAAGHLGQDDLARSAVERSMPAADTADDGLLVASGCNALAWVLLRQNESELAGQIASAAADRLNPRFSRGQYREVRMWGRLRLTGVTAASRQEDFPTAEELLADARRCTTVVDVDAMDYVNGGHQSAFGPSRVTMIAVEVAMARQEPAVALRLARSVSPTPRIPPMTRGRHLLDVAQAQTWLGQYSEAVQTLTRVHGMAPEWIRYQVLAREVVRQVQENRGRRRLDGLVPLAKHLNLVTV
ncbi:helix-turn-helix domain-containing protein [Streptomyces sp. NBC_01198]|uniref:helix-turn-helix domain-containing protein n=1 Tax=Streptomyces sp. NBC_01198 TaxID=2903769 RepID=UPI002E165619|nr:helix-turn-helix domain-containing protein [Streptomyces sp. NBC_01198]